MTDESPEDVQIKDALYNTFVKLGIAHVYNYEQILNKMVRLAIMGHPQEHLNAGSALVTLLGALSNEKK